MSMETSKIHEGIYTWKVTPSSVMSARCRRETCEKYTNHETKTTNLPNIVKLDSIFKEILEKNK